MKNLMSLFFFERFLKKSCAVNTKLNFWKSQKSRIKSLCIAIPRNIFYLTYNLEDNLSVNRHMTKVNPIDVENLLLFKAKNGEQCNSV